VTYLCYLALFLFNIHCPYETTMASDLIKLSIYHWIKTEKQIDFPGIRIASVALHHFITSHVHVPLYFLLEIDVLQLVMILRDDWRAHLPFGTSWKATDELSLAKFIFLLIKFHNFKHIYKKNIQLNFKFFFYMKI
jgi:hypothetical protein